MMEEQEQLPTPEAVPVEPTEIDFADADVSKRYDDVYQVLTPDELHTVRWRDGAYEFVCKNGITLRVQVYAPGIIRFRYAPDGIFPAVLSYALDPEFGPEKVQVVLHEQENEYLLVSERLQVVVSKSGLRVKVYDLDDRILCEDAGGYTARRTIMQGWNLLQIEKKLHKKELMMGLGDKTCGVNLSGKKFENWCSDSYGFGRETDPLYRAVPFYYAVNHGIAYGVFVDNTFKSRFDFGHTDPDTTAIQVEGGILDYYFLYGPGLDDVARAYARLTGKQVLPPMWAIGYHQCRWSYYPYSRVLEIAREFRKQEIPCDAIYLDIDYMDGYRCFTWDKAHFPEPKKMVAELQDIGFKTVVMIDPGIKEDAAYAVYQEGMERDYFIKNGDGTVVKAPVWPGFCAFPDFANPKVRSWWGDLYQDLYGNLGIAGFWNDMNEPAVFHVNHKTLPDHVLHFEETGVSTHKKIHNVYGLLMSQASFEGFRRIQPEKRPFLLTRASFSGGQRYAAVWTGDNFSEWEHLQIANVQCQRLAISGFSFCGTDIGGFAGSCEPELFVRWLQLAIFHPLMRVHSMGHHESGDAMPVEEALLTDPVLHQTDQEPWSFGEKWTDLAKKAIELRYHLLPCIYTAMWRAAQDGSPVLRHLAFADAHDPKLWEQERDFLFGEHLLVSPVVQPRVQRQGLYLPKGNWYYFWTGQPASGEIFVNVMPDQIPFFVREGAVLPVYPVMQHTGEKPIEELTLYVYYKNGVEISHLYEDAGEGYDYQAGVYSLKYFETFGTERRFVLKQSIQGAYIPSYSQLKVYLVGFPDFVKKCTVDGVEMPIKEIRVRDRSLYTLQIKPLFETIEWDA